MAVIALLQFSQLSRVGSPGHALVVVDGASATISNSDNTDVQSWRIELLDGPAGSVYERAPGNPLLLAENPSGGTPTYAITPPSGFPGSLRVRLTVWSQPNYVGDFDIDIRVMSVPTPVSSLILPPYQKLPDPLPVLGSGLPHEKPDEMNFEGQPWGWSGPNYDHDTYGQQFVQFRLLNAALALLDNGGGGGGGGSIGSSRLNRSDGAGGWLNTEWEAQSGGVNLVSQAPAASIIGGDLTVRGLDSLVLDAGVPLTWPSTAGTPGYALMTDGLGTLDWAPLAGGLNYTVGPAGSGAQFSTVQAAVDQAVLDGHERPLINIHPGNYAENVVIPNTLPNFFLKGTGGRLGVFITSLTIDQLSANTPFWGVENLATGPFTLTGTDSGSSGHIRDVFIFGAYTSTAVGGTVRMYDSYVATSGTTISTTNYMEIYRTYISSGGSSNIAVSATASLYLSYCPYVFGRIVVGGSSCTLHHNLQYSTGAGAVEDSCTGFSEIYGNTFHQNSGSGHVSGYYAKTGTSSLNEGGNTFRQALTPYFNVTAGSHITAGLNAKNLYSPGALNLAGQTGLSLTRGAVTWNWPSADGSAGYLLATDGAGTMSWAQGEMGYTVGPAGTGARFTTIQAAVNQAVTDAAARPYIRVHPGNYAENVVIPNTLPRFHLEGVGSRLGVFFTSLTIDQLGTPTTTAWTVSNICSGPCTITGSGNTGEFRDYLIFGAFSVTGSGLTLRAYDSYYAVSGTVINFTGVRLELWNCYISAAGSTNIAVNSTPTTTTQLSGCYVFGRIVATGQNLVLLHNHQYSQGAAAVSDACTTFSECYGNTFHQNGVSTAGYYEKSGTSTLSESGNTFGDEAIYPFFNVTGGTWKYGQVSAGAVYGGNELELVGATALKLGVGAELWTWPAADGTAGQFLQTNGSNVLSWDDAPLTPPAGSSGDVQLNVSSAFGANELNFFYPGGVAPKYLRIWNSGNAPPAGFQVLDPDGATQRVRLGHIPAPGGGPVSVLEMTEVTTHIQLQSELGALRGAMFTDSSGFYIRSGAVPLIFRSTTSGEEMTWPAVDGSAGQFLQTDGFGVLSFATPAAPATPTLQAVYEAGNTVVLSALQGDLAITGTEDVTIGVDGSFSFNAQSPSFLSVDGGSLDISTTGAGLGITAGTTLGLAAGGGISLDPGAGDIVLDGITWPIADGGADQVLKTNGSGQLAFANLLALAGLGSGAVMRSDHDVTTITDGTIGGSATEIRTDMVSGGATLRASLANAVTYRSYRAKASCVFKMLQGSDTSITPSGGTLTIQASVDDFVTNYVVTSGSVSPHNPSFETVSGQAYAIVRADAEAEFDANDVPGYDENTASTIVVRALASASIPSNVTVAGTGTAGTHILLEEILS
jgi:hypothetical protein